MADMRTFLLHHIGVDGSSKGVGLQHLAPVAQRILAAVYPLLHIRPKHLHQLHHFSELELYFLPSSFVLPVLSCRPSGIHSVH